MRIEKMLKIVSNELLPLSITKQLEYNDIRYLNIYEALDTVAGEEDSDTALPQAVGSKLSDEEIELREELKKDITGIFG